MAIEKLPQNAAARVTFKAFLSSDHVSAATGRTIAVQVSKNGAAFANLAAGAVNATEIGNGWYYVDLAAADTSALGPLVVRGTASGVDDVEVVFRVVNANNAGFAALPNAAAGAANGLVTAGAAANKFDAGAVESVWDAQRTNHTAAGTFGGDAADISEVPAAVLDAVANDYNDPGTIGAKINSAASAGDPWSTTLPGSYEAGTAGAILGSRLDAAVSSRQASGNVIVGGYASGQSPDALILDKADGVETGWTLRQALRVILAVLAGKSSNGGKTFRDVNDTKNRVTATVDASSNRTAIVVDKS